MSDRVYKRRDFGLRPKIPIYGSFYRQYESCFREPKAYTFLCGKQTGLQLEEMEDFSCK